MELVYLWVEDYKNIHKQGFNFSPRFDCHYDGKELTIDENDDYIENFFGDNINVTAIVGKNGSGKSHILNLLHKRLDDYDFNGFAILNKKNKIFFLTNQHDKYICLNTYTNISRSSHKIKFFLFDYSCTNGSKHNMENKFPKNDLNENLNNIIWNYIDIKKSNKLSIFEDFFLPKIIKIDITNIIFNLAYEYKGSNFGRVVQKIVNDIIEDFENENYNTALRRIMAIGNYILHSPVRDSNKLSIKDFLKEFNLVFNEMNFPESLIKKNKYNFIRNPTFGNSNTFQNYSEPWKETRNIIDVEPAKNPNIISLIPKKYRYSEKLDIDKMYYNQETIFEWEILNLTSNEINTIMSFFQNKFYKIDLISIQKVSLVELSFGEKQLIFVLNQIYRLALDTDEDNLILLLDEIDIGFHPDWQKRTIQYIIDFLSFIPEKKFHLIFTTHSPFLLSDIPKQNIIFLDKDENGKCKVVNGLNEKKQTFGANIHTLLSDSFFMEDGLMGEFAKGKIDEVIRLLNQDKLDEKELKYCEQIISIIGEPIVKNQLQRMLDSKRLKKVDEIDAIKKSMEAMQKRLDELEK